MGDELPNTAGPDIFYLYAWVGRNDRGLEGILMYPADPGPLTPGLPMIGTDLASIRTLRPEAKAAAARRGTTAKLVRFVRGDTIEVAGIEVVG